MPPLPPFVTTTVVIPVRNGAATLRSLITALATQVPRPVQLIATDTASLDGSRSILAHAAFEVMDIDIRQFGHGRTRNAAAASAHGDVIVFMTQDVLPLRSDCLQRLLDPIRAGKATASFARQVPRKDADPLEQFARAKNYPPEGRLVSFADIEELGIRAFFFSNACSAIRRDVFEALGGFPTHTIMNEDMILAARLLKSGHTVAYVADAVVEHSHSYTIWQTFKRYFDIGVVLQQGDSELGGVQAAGEGMRYVGQLFTWLWRNGNYSWLPRAIVESAAKWIGTSLGKRYKRLPVGVIRRLSMHRGYWSGPR